MNLRKIIRNILNEAYNTSIVQYCAVVIEDSIEEQKIRELASQHIPSDWTEPAHYHMTIQQGPLPDSLKRRGDLNNEVELTINMIGISENAIALGTFGYYSRNEMPHITIAFNNAGGAASDSNIIKNWTPINKIKVKGVIREIGEGNRVLKEKDLGEVEGMRTSTTTGGLNAFPGKPDEFPNPSDYDEFGNRIQDVSI